MPSRTSSGGSDAGGRGTDRRDFLARASAYDRYHRSLLPGWAKAGLAAAVLLLVGFVVWWAGASVPGDLGTALAYLLPLAAVVVLWLVSAERPSED